MDWKTFITDKEKLEKLLHLEIENIELYLEAFSHKSYANECQDREISHNERLEFLGDSVLGLYATKRLIEEFPEDHEGELTAKRSYIVKASACAHYVEQLGMDDYLLLGKGELLRSQRTLESMHADLFEAFLGALYLDRGYEATFYFLENMVYPMMQELLKGDATKNWKALLQDYCQKVMKVTPTYALIEERGPEHDKVFKVGVYLEDEKIHEGEGKSKKDAEKQASKNALEHLEEKHGH